MSRSFGVLSLTTCPPIFSSPAVMSSRPAPIRSAVDLPQPDGPTRIMNSPSATSRFMSLTASKPSSYRLVMCSSAISAIGFSLSLDCARGEAGHDPALEQEHQNHYRYGDDDRGSGDVADRLRELRYAGELRDRGWDRHRRVGRRQRDRKHEVVPADQ